MDTGGKIALVEFPNSVVENLERRFAALEKSTDSYNLFSAERSYIDYLDREQRLRPVINAIFAEREYNDVWLHIICVFTLTTKGHSGAPKVPGFLEGLYPQDVTWNSITTSENGRLDIAYYSAIGEAGAVGVERAYQNTLSLMRKLHHDLLEKLSEDASVVAAGSKTKFIDGVLRCGEIVHRFHRGQRGEEKRILFFRLLWDDRRWIKKGAEKSSGTLRTPAYFAVQLNLASDVSAFARNKKIKDRLSGFIKGINKILKQKGFPALIERKGGVQLVVNEK